MKGVRNLCMAQEVNNSKSSFAEVIRMGERAIGPHPTRNVPPNQRRGNKQLSAGKRRRHSYLAGTQVQLK